MTLEQQATEQAFTGRTRSRRTKRSVLLADRGARAFITFGGVGTIVAVSLVCVFLVWVVIPLFLPASIEAAKQAALADPGSGEPLHLAVDEYLDVAWMVTAQGELISYRTDTGKQLAKQLLFEGKRPVASSFTLRDGHVVFALDDSTVQLGTIDFATRFVPPDELSQELRGLPIGQTAIFQDGVIERTPEGQYRQQRLVADLQDPITVETESGIALIDLSVSSKGSIVALLTNDGELRLAQVTQKKNLLTGKVTTRLREGRVQVQLPDEQIPFRLLLTGLGDSVLLAWPDGRALRFDSRDITNPVLAESIDLVEDPREDLTAVGFLIGKTSLVTGDSSGRVRVWFRIKPEDAVTADGSELVPAHELLPGQAPVVSLAASPRSRMLAAGFADGAIRLYHVTSNQRLADVPTARPGGSPMRLAMSPKDDALLRLSAAELELWSVDPRHPEVTWSSIFGAVWYEGYNQPEHAWQSSSGTDDFEEKYGLVPLVFGTLKATFYSMLFAVPLALLAAIYTSEFLHPRAKARIKPTIEIMASLPSVVLGFLAALFFAPLVEDIVPECLTAFATVPFAFLAGAYLWQLLPRELAIRAGRVRTVGMVAALPAGLALAWLLGRPVERWLFAGDIKAWLDGQIGSGTGAWMFIALPLCVMLVVWFLATVVTPQLRRIGRSWSRTQFALVDLAKFAAGCFATVLIAYLIASLLNGIGWDPRGTYVDTYVQRNSLIVGVIMGFAVIPIIYTISDDALSAVPESLRAGSLGAGATPWQTAMWVVIPTAMSGLFSAMMIGLGRAVGETMIVLMAAGNTAVMDLNIFNGFRTLSANIAVELPEAVIDSSHYRMLFLAALSLFVITFLVNTVAEVIRLRFRRRAFQL
jgi:phosphate transport system permease protein